MAAITEYETEQIEKANASGRTPVVFVHGLWLLPMSWDRWRTVFEDAGFATLVAGLARRPEHGRRGQRASRGVREEDGRPDRRSLRRRDRRCSRSGPRSSGTRSAGCSRRSSPVAALSDASVAIDPAPFRGVLPLPISALKSASPVLGNPANHGRAVPLTYEQFRYAFANAVSEDEAQELYNTYAVPGSGVPLFQAATANLNPWTEVKVKTKNPERGPLLIIDGEKDHTVPWAIANASYKKQKRNKGVTEIVKMAGRGHSLTIDHGWREVADTSLDFVKRFVKP